MNKSKILRFLILSLAAAGFVLISGSWTETLAQRDPFVKAPFAKPKTATSNTAKPNSTGKTENQKTAPKGPMPVLPPAIEQRINYYKSLREEAALNGRELPKVTSVLTLEEMSVTGIFRTPRGYAAMVEAKPIKLSYTIYPGEKFFDGQLVAIEENRLVFRKVVKMSDGKFIASTENKALRKYSVQEEVQGTAPVETSGKTEAAVNTQPQSDKTEESKPEENKPEEKKSEPAKSSVIVSPVDEMNNQPQEKPKDSAKEKTDKKAKKPVKVAKKS